MRVSRFGFGLAAVLFVSGCASTTESLERATAMSIGNNTAPESITVSDVDRGVTTVKWSAVAPSGHYSCSADDMVRRPYCVKQ